VHVHGYVHGHDALRSSFGWREYEGSVSILCFDLRPEAERLPGIFCLEMIVFD
jgi:hypothetical protein